MSSFLYRVANHVQRFLTPRRLSCARLTGAVLWLGWLFSLILGPHYVDLAGQPLGADYLQFYAAGKTLAQGESAYLYDVEFQRQLEQSIIGPGLQTYHAFITPPFFAWLFVPLAALPYGVSFAIWSLLSLGLLGASIYLLHRQHAGRSFLWALTWFPVFASISFGQNALLSLFLLTAVYALWRRERRFVAGLILGLLLYKPQLTLGVALLWLLRWREEGAALVGFALSGLALAALSFGLLPEASRAYVIFARDVLPALPTWQEFPLWHLHTVRGFWRMLLPANAVADGLTLFSAVVGLRAFWRLMVQVHLTKPLAFAAAICLTCWITPHAMIYDWAVLWIAATLFWEAFSARRAELRTLYALIWLVTLLSGPLTSWQLRALPLAFQISIPILAFSLYECYLLLINEEHDCPEICHLCIWGNMGIMLIG